MQDFDSVGILGPSCSGKTMLKRLAASIPGVKAGGENALARIARERVLAGTAAVATVSACLQPADSAGSGHLLPADAQMFTGTAPG